LHLCIAACQIIETVECDAHLGQPRRILGTCSRRASEPYGVAMAN
jgi:hypothetical protein